MGKFNRYARNGVVRAAKITDVGMLVGPGQVLTLDNGDHALAQEVLTSIENPPIALGDYLIDVNPHLVHIPAAEFERNHQLVEGEKAFPAPLGTNDEIFTGSRDDFIRNMHLRDKFIVERGLWQEFVDGLPSRP